MKGCFWPAPAPCASTRTASACLLAGYPIAPTPASESTGYSVYGWCRCTGFDFARTRRLIISTKIEKPIAK